MQPPCYSVGGASAHAARTGRQRAPLRHPESIAGHRGAAEASGLSMPRARARLPGLRAAAARGRADCAPRDDRRRREGPVRAGRLRPAHTAGLRRACAARRCLALRRPRYQRRSRRLGQRSRSTPHPRLPPRQPPSVEARRRRRGGGGGRWVPSLLDGGGAVVGNECGRDRWAGAGAHTPHCGPGRRPGSPNSPLGGTGSELPVTKTTADAARPPHAQCSKSPGRKYFHGSRRPARLRSRQGLGAQPHPSRPRTAQAASDSPGSACWLRCNRPSSGRDSDVALAMSASRPFFARRPDPLREEDRLPRAAGLLVRALFFASRGSPERSRGLFRGAIRTLTGSGQRGCPTRVVGLREHRDLIYTYSNTFSYGPCRSQGARSHGYARHGLVLLLGAGRTPTKGSQGCRGAPAAGARRACAPGPAAAAAVRGAGRLPSLLVRELAPPPHAVAEQQAPAEKAGAQDASHDGPSDGRAEGHDILRGGRSAHSAVLALGPTIRCWLI